MTALETTFLSRSPEDTAALAHDIGTRLAPGDVLLLDGPIGAGKTHFARSLIQSLLRVPEDVPSPTYTLVQTYGTDAGEVWHADLYRLGSVDELVELGLTDAFGQDICLVEWPDRLGDLTPPDALWLRFEPDPANDDHRLIRMQSSDPKWAGLAERAANA